MDEIKKEYIVLFNGISTIMQELEEVISKLALLQQQAEQIYIDRTGDDD